MERDSREWLNEKEKKNSFFPRRKRIPSGRGEKEERMKLQGKISLLLDWNRIMAIELLRYPRTIIAMCDAVMVMCVRVCMYVCTYVCMYVYCTCVTCE